MSPFFAALIACGYMGAVFLTFGLLTAKQTRHD